MTAGLGEGASDPVVQACLRDLRTLRARGVVLFPVRHHSPACGHFLRRILEAQPPGWILIEGPPELEGLLPLMTHPDARAPFAAYCAHEAEGRRHAAYYPFCDASPELVAVRAGAAVGAEVRFVDLGFPVSCTRTARGRGGRRLRSLLEEAHLRRSAYLGALARKTGCRDQDELWDHLFESRPHDLDPEAFVDEVAVYCLMARRDQAAEALEGDGTLLRERSMTLGLRAALAARAEAGSAAPIVVVTGGFHTPQIAAWAAAETTLEAPPAASCTPVLIRYGFEQLDALNGYAAGMPSAAYQDALARAYAAGGADPQRAAAAAMLVDVARDGRATGAFVANAADEVATLLQADRLASLRGRAAVTRSDVQDALQSTLSKGAADAEGALVRRVVRRVFTGDAVGRVPEAAGAPPIVEDFRARAKALKVDAGPVAREVSLLLYQKAPHREASRFLHALGLLEVSFATRVAGPDFVRGEGLHRRREVWRLRWTPDVDSELVEASVYGATVSQAAAARLEAAIEGLAGAGQARNAARAVQVFMQALSIGAESSLEVLEPLVRAHLSADPRIERVVEALITLALTGEGREPLEGFRTEQVEALARAAFARTLALLPDAARAPAAEVEARAAALASLRQLSATRALEDLAARLGGALESGLAATDGHPQLQGVLTGLAYGFARLDAEALAGRVRGRLRGTSDDAEAKVGFLVGVLQAAREVAWRVPEIVEGLDRLFADWDESTFMRALPSLRLAFANLTPREVDRVAAAVGGPGPEGATKAEEGAPDARVDAWVQQALLQDGLQTWGAS